MKRLVFATLLCTTPVHAQTAEEIAIAAQVRTAQVRAQALDKAALVDFLVLGDSTSQDVDYSFCGDAFNAAVNGSRVADVQAMSNYVVPLLHPRKIMINVGANHFWGGTGDVVAFSIAYGALLDSLAGYTPILNGVPNNSAANFEIAIHAYLRGYPFVEPTNGPGQTTDGVHRTAAGLAAHIARVDAVC